MFFRSIFNKKANCFHKTAACPIQNLMSLIYFIFNFCSHVELSVLSQWVFTFSLSQNNLCFFSGLFDRYCSINWSIDWLIDWLIDFFIFSVLIVRLDCSVTTLSSEPSGTGLFVAGYQDGSVRLYDRRLSPSEAQVIVFDGHSSSVVSTKMLDHVLNHKLYSGSVDGEVKLWERETAKLRVSRENRVRHDHDGHSSQGRGALLVSGVLNNFSTYLRDWMISSSSVDWLIDWLIDCSIGWSIVRLVDRLLVDCSIDWLIHSIIYWPLIGWMNGMESFYPVYSSFLKV